MKYVLTCPLAAKRLRYILPLFSFLISLTGIAQKSLTLKELILCLDADTSEISQSMHHHQYKQTFSSNFPGGGFVKKFEQKTNKTNEQLSIRFQDGTHEIQLTSSNFEMLKKYRHQLQQQGFVPTGHWKGNSVKEEYQYTKHMEGMSAQRIYFTVEPGIRFTIFINRENYKPKETKI